LRDIVQAAVNYYNIMLTEFVAGVCSSIH